MGNIVFSNNMLKIMIIFYALVVFVVTIFNGFSEYPIELFVFPTFQLTINPLTLFGVIPFVFGLMVFIVQLFTFSIGDSLLVNFMLWIMRGILAIEIVYWIKQLFNPSS